MESLRRAAFWAGAELARALSDRDREVRGLRTALLVLVLGADYAYLDHAGLLALLAGPGWDAAAMSIASDLVAPFEYERTAYVFVCRADELEAFERRDKPLAPPAKELCPRIVVTHDRSIFDYVLVDPRGRPPEYALLARVRPRIQSHVDEHAVGRLCWDGE